MQQQLHQQQTHRNLFESNLQSTMCMCFSIAVSTPRFSLTQQHNIYKNENSAKKMDHTALHICKYQSTNLKCKFYLITNFINHVFMADGRKNELLRNTWIQIRSIWEINLKSMLYNRQPPPALITGEMTDAAGMSDSWDASSWGIFSCSMCEKRGRG